MEPSLPFKGTNEEFGAVFLSASKSIMTMKVILYRCVSSIYITHPVCCSFGLRGIEERESERARERECLHFVCLVVVGWP